MRALRSARAGLTVLALAVAVPSFADVPAADEAAAQKKFAEGEKAFKKGDFNAAAEAFDEANRLAPHPASLWNAARAWHKAGELPRAANLYRRYLRIASKDATDRNSATSSLADLMLKLGRIDVVVPEGASVRIDRIAVDAGGLVVNPGSHAVEAELGTRKDHRVVEVTAGGVVSITLLQEGPKPAPTEPPSASVPPPPPPPAASPSAPVPAVSSSPRGEQPRPSQRPLAPWTLAIPGGVTATLTGFTIGLGVDVLSKREAYDKAPSQTLFDQGQDAQLATNVLLGVTLGTAVITIALAAFAVDWATPPRKAVRVGPTGLSF